MLIVVVMEVAVVLVVLVDVMITDGVGGGRM